MTREWKPGDVAMVTWTDAYDGQVQHATRILVSNGTVDEAVGLRRDAWWGEDGYLEAANRDIVVRPLVVIDPEDREQVERLAGELLTHAVAQRSTVGAVADTMQAALREFANPTPLKPDEPQGLGAVVEDKGGLRWTRVESGEAETRNPWYPAACDEQPTEWDDISAVRVLSEGVQS